ncbi:MAG TPA: hypothetical protein PLD25_30955 [Chloroflexota bacterium]|nr:hypothetical protein [Chloroflexota bacterium]HUM67589.1 hypothetical protein [Chloroflexota bacterium]
MTNNNGNGHGVTANNDFTGFTYELAEPITLTGFSVTYDRKFNTGNFESLNPAITIWVKTTVPEGEAFDHHQAKERVRRMARENVRAQLLRLQGNPEVVFLGLQPPHAGDADPIFVRTVSVSLVQKVNLGDYNSITPGYTDWADVRHVAHSPGELHMALARLWQSLWANVEDEISRARGHGGSGGFFGLPLIPVEDLTTAAPAADAGRGLAPAVPQANGRFRQSNPGERHRAGHASTGNGSQA